jgi:hypothetical protein
MAAGRVGAAAASVGVLVLVAAFLTDVVVAGHRPGTTAGAAAGSFRFSSEVLDAGEGQGFVRVVVERTDLPVSRATVAFHTAAGSASEREDFDATEGLLTFDVGVSSASFVVVVRNDEVEEPTEQLTTLLGDRSAVAGTALIRIFDDDRRPHGSSAAGSEPAATAAGSGGSSMAGTSSAAGAGGAAAAAATGGGSRTAAAVAGAPVASASGGRVTTRSRPARPAAARRVTVRQSPVTPFELRPLAPTEALDPSLPLAIDPVLAVAAALLLARVAAEVWFRLRTGAA